MSCYGWEGALFWKLLIAGEFLNWFGWSTLEKSWRDFLREESELLFWSLWALKVSNETLFPVGGWIESLRRQTLLLSSERGFRFWVEGGFSWLSLVVVGIFLFWFSHFFLLFCLASFMYVLCFRRKASLVLIGSIDCSLSSLSSEFCTLEWGLEIEFWVLMVFIPELGVSIRRVWRRLEQSVASAMFFSEFCVKLWETDY